MARQLPLELPHETSLSRLDIVVSPSNRLAVEAVDAWPRWRHAVLLILGPRGSGKTHLARAWADRAGAEFAAPGCASALLSRPDFRVVIDDLHLMAEFESELFALVNAARLGQGSVLATSAIMPAALDTFTVDLRSRLNAASRTELADPDDDLLAGVLHKLFADRQIEVSPGIIRLLVSRAERSLSAMAKWVEAIDERSLAEGRRVTRPLVSRILAEAEAACHEDFALSPYASRQTECER